MTETVSEWVEWIRWGAPELARRVTGLDPTRIRQGGPTVGRGVRGSTSPARDTVIALTQDATREVREREALHRGVLHAGLARLDLSRGCTFLAATASQVEKIDPDTLWDTGRTLTHLLARCDQIEGISDPMRVIRDLDITKACQACGHTVVLFDGVHAICLRCRDTWLPLTPILTP